MAKLDQTPQSLVTRTLRAAVKIGDDYYTIEETITLPPTAEDEEIQRAVATGLRMYELQRAAVEQQVRDLREHVVTQATPVQMREPDAPASEKQRAYMDYLLRELNWDHERLAAFASEHSYNLLTLTKREASELIDLLKQVLAGTPTDQAADDADDDNDEGDPTPEPQPVETAPAQQQAILPIGERATQRQLRALERLVEERGIDLAGELHARFGNRGLDELSMDEAGQLLSEWQQHPRQLRPRTESARRAA